MLENEQEAMRHKVIRQVMPESFTSPWNPPTHDRPKMIYYCFLDIPSLLSVSRLNRDQYYINI